MGKNESNAPMQQPNSDATNIQRLLTVIVCDVVKYIDYLSQKENLDTSDKTLLLNSLFVYTAISNILDPTEFSNLTRAYMEIKNNVKDRTYLSKIQQRTVFKSALQTQ